MDKINPNSITIADQPLQDIVEFHQIERQAIKYLQMFARCAKALDESLLTWERETKGDLFEEDYPFAGEHFPAVVDRILKWAATNAPVDAPRYYAVIKGAYNNTVYKSLTDDDFYASEWDALVANSAVTEGESFKLDTLLSTVTLTRVLFCNDTDSEQCQSGYLIEDNGRHIRS